MISYEEARSIAHGASQMSACTNTESNMRRSRISVCVCLCLSLCVCLSVCLSFSFLSLSLSLSLIHSHTHARTLARSLARSHTRTHTRTHSRTHARTYTHTGTCTRARTSVHFRWSLRPQCPVDRRKIVVCWARSSLQTGSRCAWYPPFSVFSKVLKDGLRFVLRQQSCWNHETYLNGISVSGVVGSCWHVCQIVKSTCVLPILPLTLKSCWHVCQTV